VFEELAVPRQVLRGRCHVAAAGDHQRTERLISADDPAVGGRRRHDDVVAGADLQTAEHRVEAGVAVLDVDQLVADGVAVQRAVAARVDPGHLDVVVGEQHPTTRDSVDIGAEVDRRGADVPRCERHVGRRVRCVTAGV
jgi:hypothetical protein